MTYMEDIARHAYETYNAAHQLLTLNKSWWDLSATEKEAWREVVRTVVSEAASKKALAVLELEA